MTQIQFKWLWFSLIIASTYSCATDTKKDESWISLFNGKDLSGWTIKFSGLAQGENYKNTFRVEDGAIKVAYDQYQNFNGKYGHIFYQTPYSHYILRLQYRFSGKQTVGGPEWGYKNSGILFHAQAPESMPIEQDFPVSTEVQLRGGNGNNVQPTANVCTPGTHIVFKGQLDKRHCIASSSATYHSDQWVNIELEVHGNNRITHKVNGLEVISYSGPQLDEDDKDAQHLLQQGTGKTSAQGYIVLQAKSHPIEYRNIELQVLTED